MTRWPQAEYIAANRARLETIGAGVEACFDADADLETHLVSIVPDRVPPTIVETPSSADVWMEDDSTLLPAEAAQYAVEYDASLASYATTAKDGLLTWATKKALGGRSKVLLRQLLIGEMPPELLHYDTARWRKTEYEWYSGVPDSGHIEVQAASLALSGLEIWASAKQHTVAVEDGELHKSLVLRYLGDELRDVDFRVSSAHPDLISRLVTIFGEDTKQLMVWSAGAFEDEAELDAGLAAFATAHPQVPASELRDILAEVRAHGVAANKAMSIETPDMFLPDTDQIDEFIKVLG